MRRWAEDLEQQMAEFVAGLSPEEYERLGPALREMGLALAETREAQRTREALEHVRDAYDRVLEDLDHAKARAIKAFQLLDDAL